MNRANCLPGALLLAAAMAARAEEITLSNGEWRPYLSAQAPHQGVGSRIVSEAFGLEGIKVRYVFRPWQRAYREAQVGDVHGSILWGPGPPGSDRATHFHFSDTVLVGKTVFFHLRSFAFDWHGYDDLVRLRIGGTLGYNYAFENHPGIRIDRAATDEISFTKLLAGRFQLFPSDLYGGRYVLKQHFTPAQVAQITNHPRPYIMTRYHLIMSKQNPANARYIALFNSGLKKLKDSGKYASYLAQLEN